MHTKEEAPLLEILKILAPDSSTSTLRSWIEKGRILVNGKQATRAKDLIAKGSEVILSPTVSFLPGGIKILYSDKDVVVLEKPAGLLSVATDFQKENTVHAYLKKNLNAKEIFPVHRLDRETSGVMLFALSKEARTHFKEEFQERRVKKTYVAVCEGVFKEKSGIWESLLQEDPSSYFVREVKDANLGKQATTHFKVIDGNSRYTLVEMDLKTGRKNQLRVHCQAAGHSIVGDTKYGAKTNPLKRLCLHAFHLSFTHPKTKKTLTFKTPHPPEFVRICKGSSSLKTSTTRLS